MSDVAIRVDGLGKRYHLGETREKYATLRDRLTRALSLGGLMRRLRAKAPQPFWALKDVSFEVRTGEVVGIIGRNGAGKSTLLKILSRITEPTEGEADLSGRVGSLLEVGTGFHAELTGRENIYLNGAILGMKRREIAAKFDDIVGFAEVEKFLDSPVKQYSSGMYMRLAFAVAAHLEPEILIVDEVLAVGDAEFQKKCLGKMSEIARGGRTVLFVSHNMGAVQNLCSRILLLERGRVRMEGPSAETIRFYLTAAQQFDGKLNFAGRRSAPTKVEILDGWLERDGMRTGSLQYGDVVTVTLRVRIHEPTRFSAELLLRQQDGVPIAFAPSGLAMGWEVNLPPGDATIRCKLPPAHLAAGQYSIDVMMAESGVQFLDYLESGLGFEIEGVAVGPRNWSFHQNRGQGHALWDVQFSIEDERTAIYVAS